MWPKMTKNKKRTTIREKKIKRVKILLLKNKTPTKFNKIWIKRSKISSKCKLANSNSNQMLNLIKRSNFKDIKIHKTKLIVFSQTELKLIS